MAIKYPKILGNADTGGAPTDVDNQHADGFSKFDLLTRTRLYDGISAESLPASIFTHIITHGVDGHTEAYAFIVIKNIEEAGASPTNLTLQKISIHEGFDADGDLGTEVWGTDGTTLTHITSFPIECDYKKKDGSGNDVKTPANDVNEGAPFVGIQNESNGNTGSGGTATLIQEDNGADVNNITDANFFAKFKVVDINGQPQLEMVASTATDHHLKIPIFDAHLLCQDINGGIPNNSYAAFMIRVNVDDVQAFDSQQYTLNINHDGITADNTSADIRIPISLFMSNEMLCEVRVGNSLVATNNQSATHSQSLRDMINVPNPDITQPTAAAFYDDADTSLTVSGTTMFLRESFADTYIANNGNITGYNDTKEVFTRPSNNLTWTEASAVKENKTLTVSISDDGTLFSAENIAADAVTSGTFVLDETQNEQTLNTKQSNTGSSVASIPVLPHGGYANFDFATDATNFVATFTAVGDRDDETKVTSVTVPYIKYPVFSIPAVTSDKTCSADFPPTSGVVFGVNSNSWGTHLIDTSPILHTTATSATDNYTFPVLHNHLQSAAQHFVKGHTSLYGTIQGDTTEALTLQDAKSVVDINVRINSHAADRDVNFNGITTHSASTGVKRGAGFADTGFEVEQCTYASSAESTSALAAFGGGATSNGDGADDVPPAGISTLANKNRDYSVKLVTTNARTTVELGEYDYATRQISGLGAERYVSTISLPTGVIDFGEGLVPNHIADNEKTNFCFAQYPSLPDLSMRVFDNFIAGSASVESSNEESPTLVARWQKLTVLPNTLTGAVSSTRNNATDGLYDWAKDCTGHANLGTFKMPSTNNATVADGNANVDIQNWEVCAVNGTVADGAGIIVMSTSSAANIQQGMRLIHQVGSAANTTEFLSKKLIVTEINTGTGAVTFKEDLGYAADGSSLTAEPDLPAITGNPDIILVDDWIQPNMMVEHDNLLSTSKGYYISGMTYVGGDNDGQTYSVDTLNAARTAGSGATAVRLALKHKDDNTVASPTGSESTKKITIFKPYQNFSQVEAGVNLFYEVKNQPLNRVKVGEKFRIRGGNTDPYFVNNTSLTSTPAVGQIATLASTTGTALSGSLVDIIVDGSDVKEFGVTKSDGTDLLSKKNVGSSGPGPYAYAQYYSSKLGIYEFAVTDIEAVGDGTSIYVKEFTFKAQNAGCEDLYLHSAEFVDATWVKHTQAGGIVTKMQPNALNINWQVAKQNSSTFANSIELGNSPSNLKGFSPSALLELGSDNRVDKIGGINNVGINNSFGCRFSVTVGGGVSGSYFKYLKIGYVRDTGRTKFYNNGGVLTERIFSDKEVFYAYVPIVCHIDATAKIRLQDVDGSDISNNESISIEGLIA